MKVFNYMPFRKDWEEQKIKEFMDKIEKKRKKQIENNQIKQDGD
jgi:hypothetical protein